MDQLTLTPEEIQLRELTATELAPARQAQLAEFLLSEIRQKPRRSRGRMFGIIAAFLAAITLTGGVAYAFIAKDRPADPYGAYCYPDQNPERGETWTGTEGHSVMNPKTNTFEAISLVDGCAAAWRIGVVHAPGQTVTLGKDINPVPDHLAVCINDKREALVFPGPDSLCEQLGFVLIAPDPNATP
jgi:hypothetical protein